MTSNQIHPYSYYTKRAWLIYSLITIAVVLVLVFFVATDNEEKFFYGLMPAAAAYVLRPGERQLGKLIFKFTGISPPSENNKEKEQRVK